MLILTRRLNERIRINDLITIDILDIKANQVRFGIEAPRCVVVYREEIYQRIFAAKLLGSPSLQGA